MNSIPTRRLSLVLSTVILAALPVSAGKRRAVRTPTRPASVSGSVKGVVTDAVTGQPVINAKVKAGRTDTTSSTGAYEINNASGYATIDVEVTRSGYKPFTTSLPAGDHTLNIALTPTATVTLRKTDQTQVLLDLDSFEFGYASGFSYLSAPFEDFCTGPGTTVRIDRSEMKRITGPATFVNEPNCCDSRQTMKISIELKGSAPANYLFADSCFTINPINVIARNHTTGDILYIPLTEVAEVVFP